MAQAISMPMPRVTSRAAAVPWYVWCAVVANTSSMIGVHWDISWHRSIGRDTFWTPAHMAIYLCGVLAGISSAYMILTATFSKAASGLREAGVSMWGFRGPLGAFIMAWGGVAMLTSAPFDDWWHNAYGLDVRIISPPHTLLAMGIFNIQLGAVMLILGHMNRASGEAARTLRWMYLYMGGLAVVNMATFIMEYTFRVNMHSAVYYRAVGMAIPFFLFAASGSAGMRWATTKVAAIYMLFWQVMNVVLPLFPAEPKLGPIYHQVTHFAPSTFPMLLVVPAFACDMFLQGWGERMATWKAGMVAGLIFMTGLLAVQWPLGDFLLSPLSRNWFFYTAMYDYSSGPNTYTQRHMFYPWEKTMAQFWSNLAWAFASSMLTSMLGLMMSRWLVKVKR
jgi:hypothetical protein